MKIRRFLGFWALAAILAACNPVMLPTPPSDVDLGGRDGGTTEEEQPNPDETISVESVSLEASLIPLIGGQERVLKAFIFPSNATDQGLIWSSGNNGVATINSEGKVTARFVSGDALITVLAAGGKSAQCLVRVSATGKEPVGTPSATPKAGQITVSWPLPSLAGFAKTALTCSTPGETTRTKEVLVSDNPNNSWTFTGLTDGKPYKITLIAHYEDGGYSDAAELENIIPATRITETNLTTLAPRPVTGAYPSTSLPGSYNQFISVTRSWTRDDGASASDLFRAGKVYAAVLNITARTGYNFEGLTSASFSYDGNPAATITAEIRADYQFAKITITFPPTATVSVSGTISGAGGSPLGGATAQLMSGGVPILVPATTNAAGTYTINGVSAGRYTIAVSAPSYAPGTIAAFDVNTAPITGKDSTLTTQVTARNITNIITPPTPAAAPVTGAAFTSEQSAQYTGSVSWKDSGGGSVSIFEPGKIYTATCTLTARTSWSFAGLTQGNFLYTGPGTHTITSVSATQVTLSVTYPPLAWTEVTVPNDNGTSLPDKLQWIRENGEKGRNYIIALSGPETMTTQTLSLAAYYETLANTRITLKGNNNTIRLNGSGALFSLYGVSGNEKITLVLENVTLVGKDNNTSTLVVVDHYANLETNNTTISGNNGNGVFGGGVYVDDYSSFTMNGGEISNNTTTYYGGGVYVRSNSSFTMNEGAIISNNTAGGFGGGVYVVSYGSFTMNEGAIISNNTAGGDGGGVHVSSFSSFTMAGGEISGNTAAGGGGVYASILDNSYYFRKTGGLIYGDTNTTHTPGSKENTATSVPVTGNGNGHAVYVEGGRKRNSDAFENDDISTDGYGTANGWE